MQCDEHGSRDKHTGMQYDEHGSRGALRIKIASVLMSGMVLPQTFPEPSNATAMLLVA